MLESSKPRCGVASLSKSVQHEPTGLIVSVVTSQTDDERPRHVGSSQRTFRKCVEQLMHGS